MTVAPDASSPAAGRVPPRLSRLWRELLRLIDDESVPDLAGAMTLLLAILHLVSTPQIREAIVLVSVVGLLDRRLLRRPEYWFGLTAIFVTNHLLLWQALDNHKYLLTYWCLAMGIAATFPDRSAVLALNARLLIGLCFLVATVWKIFSGEFLDGTFFHFALLTDRRFSGFADLVGGVPMDATASNLSALESLKRPYGGLEEISLRGAPRIAVLSKVMAWWTVGIEGLIAVLFLLPGRFRLAGFRDAALFLFMLSTYPVATVVGFGRILTILGFVQTLNRLRIERPLYLACFVLLPIYRFPFGRVIRALIK